MKYLVTLKRKQTTNAAQNARQMRVEVSAPDPVSAKFAALKKDNNGRYFTFESLRTA